MDIYGLDFPHTYPDSRGAIIDWSGCVGIFVCLFPGCLDNQQGPYFSLNDTLKAATRHRASYHTDLDTGIIGHGQAEAKAAAKPPAICMDCNTRKSNARGLCKPCADRRAHAWLVLNQRIDPEESYSGYRERLRQQFPELRKQPAPKPTPKPARQPEPEKAPQDKPRADHPWRASRDGKGPIKHGTLYAYNHHKCRCEACRAASTQAMRDRRARNQAEPKPLKHGLLNTYAYHKCRCDLCKAAAAEYRRNYRNRKRDTNEQ